MKKYIHIAKCMKPTLTDEASAAISEEYTRLRSQDMMDTNVARVRMTWQGAVRNAVARRQHLIAVNWKQWAHFSSYCSELLLGPETGCPAMIFMFSLGLSRQLE